eukprot:353206-Chlamydomonas_euryale.AAC.1
MESVVDSACPLLHRYFGGMLLPPGQHVVWAACCHCPSGTPVAARCCRCGGDPVHLQRCAFGCIMATGTAPVEPFHSLFLQLVVLAVGYERDGPV